MLTHARGENIVESLANNLLNCLDNKSDSITLDCQVQDVFAYLRNIDLNNPTERVTLVNVVKVTIEYLRTQEDKKHLSLADKYDYELDSILRGMYRY